MQADEIRNLVLRLCYKHELDLDDEGMDFIMLLVESYQGEKSPKPLTSWLKLQIKDHFKSLKKRPQWIQSSEWPFHNGKPMIFVGQTDIRVDHSQVGATLFHDDTSFYLFIPNEPADSADYKVIVQQY